MNEGDGQDPKSAYDDLEDLFEHAPCGYLSAGPDGRILRSNETFTAWTGHSADAIVGRRFHDLLTIPGKIYYETHFAPLLRMQGSFNEVALDIVRADGSRFPVLVNAVVRQDEAGALRFIRITIFNATDRRRYESELLEARRLADGMSKELRVLNAGLEARVLEEVEVRLKAEDALRQAQKMETLGQLTGGIAHDFNNMLAGVIGALNIIQRRLQRGDTSVDKFIDGALDSAYRAASLTQRLLAFSRQQPLAPVPLDVNKMAAGMTELLARTLGETIEVETVLGAGLWTAKADPSELENAILNMAVNARDAMPDGGKLTIETSNAYVDEIYARANTMAEGQYVLIAVSDTGSGMAPQVLEKAFDPFFTTKGVGKGTGLGLSQVFGFARQSCGQVKIYSELGHGTTVKIYLPRQIGPSTQAASSRPDAGGVPEGSEMVLVVEDDHRVRANSVEALRELGYRPVAASNGAEALALLGEYAEIALVFTDVVMPEMTGRQLVDRALAIRPDLKVLYTTGYTRNAIVHNGVLDSGTQFLQKPYSIQQLARKVRAVLDLPSA
ncbi:MAG TPA: ATP-binding protein [Devosia sp.]|nr:ATP-binding protein [Devosia sp.]